MANLLRWLKLPPEQVWAMGTLNPARLLGLDRKGRLEVGADADLVSSGTTPHRRPHRGSEWNFRL
jgi:imidazolonepropionase-like amidohydrolase